MLYLFYTFLTHPLLPRFLLTGERDESLMGKTVRIQAGQWKGYLGTVSHTTATHVQVELHSRLKKVMVVKERVHVIGDKFGATGEAGDGGDGFTAPANSFMGGATPMHGGATPMHGGATPMHGGATPMHDGYGYVVYFNFYACNIFGLLTDNQCKSPFYLQPEADQLRHTLACQMTSGDLVDRLIVMLIHRWVQRWEVDGAVLPMMRIHRHRATHLEIRISTLEVSIISLEWIETMRSWFC